MRHSFDIVLTSLATYYFVKFMMTKKPRMALMSIFTVNNQHYQVYTTCLEHATLRFEGRHGTIAPQDFTVAPISATRIITRTFVNQVS
jgi:hypothetical protein